MKNRIAQYVGPMLVLLSMAASIPVFGQALGNHAIYFGSDRTYPSYDQWLELDGFVSELPKGKVIFRVSGHADEVGINASNKRLAEERTHVVVRHLMEYGVDPIDIRFSSFGEERPIASGSDVANAQNRRVEISAQLKLRPNLQTEYKLAELASNGCLVNPPLPESKLPVERFSFDAESKQEIRVASGTILLIPAMAFVDVDGQQVDGKIDLTYEEFHDRAEVFLSGIPMKYDSLGRELPMETYGMFRILASNGEGSLDLAPGKSIDLEFVSSTSRDDVNFYHLDPRHGRWIKLGKAPLASGSAEADQFSGLSPAVANYLHLTSGTGSVKKDEKDIEARFHSSEYICERKMAEKLRLLRDGTLRQKRTFKKALKELPEFQIKVEHIKTGEDRNWVKFSLIENNLNGNKNRAWKTAFKSHVWQYDGPLSRSEFLQRFHQRKFQDVLISFNETTDQVVMELKDLDGIVALPLMKVTKGEIDVAMYRQVYDEMLDEGTKRMLAKKESQFEKRFKVYQHQLELRNRRLGKEADRAYSLAVSSQERDLEWAWEESRELMTPSELEMDFSAWDDYCTFQGSLKERESEIRFASRTTVVRKLRISTCGIYNCDRLKNLVSPVEITANFVANSDVLDWYEVFVFDENLNSYLRHSRDESSVISLDPEGLLGLVVTDMSGNNFYLQKEDVMAMNHGGKHLRIMNLEPLSPNSNVEDIRTLLSLGF